MKTYNRIIYLDISYTLISIILLFLNYTLANSSDNLIPVTGALSIVLRILGGIFLLASFIPGANNFSHITYKLIERRWLSKYVRHTHYFKIIMTVIGFSLILATPVFLITPALLIIVAYPFMLYEEKILRIIFGAEYQLYQKETFRLFPKIKK